MTAKVKTLINKKLTGREVAAILLTHAIQDGFGLPLTYSDAEAQTAYNGIDGRCEEYPSLNKWMRLEDIIPNLRNMANVSALSAASDLNMILSKIKLFEIRWLADGCEAEWRAFIDAKRKQLQKNDCMPHIADMFDPLRFANENNRVARDAKLINNLYCSAIRHIQYYMACVALCDIVDDIIKVDMKPVTTGSKHILEISLSFFNLAIDNQLFSQYLSQTHPKMKPVIADIHNINEINLDDYAPSPEGIAKATANIQAATKDTLQHVCAEAIESMVKCTEALGQ